jgi:hypothetical protein
MYEREEEKNNGSKRVDIREYVNIINIRNCDE